ncbi:nuclear protein Sth1p/NPS1 [[Candida] jaroonii]|uniref:Nuclear protein Sth1p/NPS1 n=1 Tax=[Candida] jaroonii TaxID=467808 RepID=A0ACA9YEV9_9ASCO|nr:nuclear protein Sth1p/NPS1 [[Candida] jaroonii]
MSTDTEYKYPESKGDLNFLLSEYQRLSKSSESAKEQHDEGKFTDPNVNARLTIESIFYKVIQNHYIYSKESTKFYDELTVNDNDVDYELLQKQIIGLQLLSKDLDLPEDLQIDFKQTLGDFQITEENNDELIFENSVEFNDYNEKLKKLGINVKDIQPPQDKLGNLTTEQSISSKISNRIQDLENVPLSLGTFNIGEENEDYSQLQQLKLNSLIELKSLKVLSKQKQLKRLLINYLSIENLSFDSELSKNSLINLIIRSFNQRNKIKQNEPEKLAIKLDEKQKLETKKKQHLLQLERIKSIIDYCSGLMENKINKNNRKNGIIKNITNFHNIIAKDESKKLEKTAKQRLQALKANDEEAYMKLLDETKDHRITHLLKQTNTFLDSLAQAVKVQQVESGAEIPMEQEVKDQDNEDEIREKIDYYQVAHRIKEEIKVQPSILIGGTLKEYQLKGLQWMVSLYNNKLNGILADEMGLGKTIQSISLITYLIEKKHEDKFLVIVPLSTITNWTMEFEKWAPSVKTIVYKGSQQQRRDLQPEVRLGRFQVLLTTYEYIIRERPILAKFEYSHMIIDEGHRMKNAESKLSITLRTYYRTKNRLILTGTPLQNNLPELWALLNFVLPKIFNSVKSFDEWFNTPFANTGNQERIDLTEEESLLVIRRLHKVLRPFLLRRLKKDVEKDLPDKVEKVLKCNLSGLQYILYQQMLKHNALFVGSDVGNTKSGIKGLNNKIMQLRKICNHPFVFEEVETVLNSSRLTNDLIWRTSGKFELLDRVLPKFKASGHRVLMFFQMTQVMDIMEDFLRWREMQYLRLDGSTKAEDRQDMLKVFNAPNSEYFCFLLSTRAGGLGLNLQTADTVIIFDTDWNPHQDLQAQDRAHRIGQKNEVRILRLITNDSVEEVILERAHQKLDIDGKVIQAGKFDNKSTAEEQEEFLKKLLEAETSNEESEEKNMLDDEEINEILARSEDEKVLFAQMDIERNKQDKLYGGFKNRLIGESELPPVFTEDISHHFEKDTKELTRMRNKKRVKYDDGLTEEQWLMAMDDDNDTVEDAIRRKERRAAKRRKTLALKEGLDEDEIDDLALDIDDDEDDDDDDEPEPEQEQEPQPQPEQPKEEDFSDNPIITKGQEILNKMNGLTNANNEEIIEVFLKLPSRKLYPDYYKIIKKPVSVSQIEKALKSNKYFNIEDFRDDILTMCLNAKTYNEEGSGIYDAATIIENFINEELPV